MSDTTAYRHPDLSIDRLAAEAQHVENRTS